MSKQKIYQQQMPLLGDSPASPTAPQANEKPAKMTGISGRIFSVLFGKATTDGSWVKMFLDYCQVSMEGSLERFSGNWPQAGMILSGRAYRLPRLVRRISARGSSYLPTMRAQESGAYQYQHGDHTKKALTLTGWVEMFPTPWASDGSHGGRVTPRKSKEGGNLIEAVSARMYPTPNATDGTKAPKFFNGGNPSLPCAIEILEGARLPDGLKLPNSGQLNPQWVEWLMGFPDGWTDLQDSAEQ